MRNQVALWAGISAFFSTLLAIGAINFFNPSERLRFLSGVVVALITAGTVYAKQRLDAVKQEPVHVGTIVIRDMKEKKLFTLELDGNPEDIETKKEVVFRVEKIDMPRVKERDIQQ